MVSTIHRQGTAKANEFNNRQKRLKLQNAKPNWMQKAYRKYIQYHLNSSKKEEFITTFRQVFIDDHSRYNPHLTVFDFWYNPIVAAIIQNIDISDIVSPFYQDIIGTVVGFNVIGYNNFFIAAILNLEPQRKLYEHQRAKLHEKIVSRIYKSLLTSYPGAKQIQKLVDGHPSFKKFGLSNGNLKEPLWFLSVPAYYYNKHVPHISIVSSSEYRHQLPERAMKQLLAHNAQKLKIMRPFRIIFKTDVKLKI